MITDENEPKRRFVDYLVRLASYVPDLLEIIGTPGPVSKTVRHAARLIPAVRNSAANDAYDRMGNAVNTRLTSILASQQQLGDRCDILEQENIKMKFELADAANQVQLLNTETQALKTEIGSLRKRNLYLSLGVVAAFLVAISDLALRLAR